jgi:uncharacterized LabA/DUF88 family protein
MFSLNSTHIHIDLRSIIIKKIDIDKYVYGLLRHCVDNMYCKPYIFTANLPIGVDISYLTVLKNNSVGITDEVQTNADLVLSDKWENPEQLLEYKMIEDHNSHNIHNSHNKTKICIYMDWDNIQVSAENVKQLIYGITQFIESVKVYTEYSYYTFLHTKVPDRIKTELKKHKVNIINIVKDKQKNGDEEMIRFIQKNTMLTDSICIVSGDRDFSCLMVEYVRNNHSVFLVYNKQALYTFKMNKHWIRSIDILCLLKNEMGNQIMVKNELDGWSYIDPVKLINKKKNTPGLNTKPCKFFNLYTCETADCLFLHICGICGGNHKSKDFHPLEYNLKSQICKRYNNDCCMNSSTSCNFLHICLNCKGSHKLSECGFIVMMCPICDISAKTKIDFAYHLIHPDHIQKTKIIENIITSPSQNHILITL